MSGRRTQQPTSSRGFTLTELLIVMGIIVIVALIAVPSFRAMSGGRSTEAAQNQLAGFLQRARQEAIGAQEMRGVAFILSSDTGRPTAVMVRQVNAPDTPDAIFPTADVYLDAVPDRDTLPLSAGVGIQMVDDCNITTTAPAGTIDPSKDVRTDDAYIGMNTAANVNGSTFSYGGVILFDGFGRVVSKEYAFKCYTRVPAITGTKQLSQIASLWKMVQSTGMSDFKPGQTVFTLGPNGEIIYTVPPTRSAFGFLLFDQDAFDNLGFTPGDPQNDTSIQTGKYKDQNDAAWKATPDPTDPLMAEAKEERWLDANSTPLLVNRNNGTLLKGQ